VQFAGQHLGLHVVQFKVHIPNMGSSINGCQSRIGAWLPLTRGIIITAAG
jgi:hypothetical protein